MRQAVAQQHYRKPEVTDILPANIAIDGRFSHSLLQRRAREHAKAAALAGFKNGFIAAGLITIANANAATNAAHIDDYTNLSHIANGKFEVSLTDEQANNAICFNGVCKLPERAPSLTTPAFNNTNLPTLNLTKEMEVTAVEATQEHAHMDTLQLTPEMEVEPFVVKAAEQKLETITAPTSEISFNGAAAENIVAMNSTPQHVQNQFTGGIASMRNNVIEQLHNPYASFKEFQPKAPVFAPA